MINFFIKTFGCQANVADSQDLAKLLTEIGAQEVESENSADLIIINTCAIRELAEQKLYSYIGRLSKIKKIRPYLKVGVIGCVASYRKQELYSRFDHVSFVYGARDELQTLKAYLINLCNELMTTKQFFEQHPENVFGQGQDRDVKKIVETKKLLTIPNLFSKASKINSLSYKPQELVRSMINIMTGCNKYCSYCIVPFTRGRETSFAMSKILDQVKKDIENGAKEITLLGQNVNSYIDPESNSRFPELLQKVAEIDGDFWVRFMSPHPQDMTRDLFEVMAQHGNKLCNYLHFPMQSGSNRILQLMNRNYTAEEYLEKIGWLRSLMPHATISTDIIVGFPGETEKDYLATREMLDKIKFDFVFSFIYSKRKYTKAFEMDDQNTHEIKVQRLNDLQARQVEIALELNSQKIGKNLKVLVEKRLTDDKLLARTEGSIRVLVSSTENKVNSFLNVEITDASVTSLVGKF